MFHLYCTYTTDCVPARPSLERTDAYDQGVCCVQVTCDENFKLGFNRVYDKNLANGLRRIYKRHEHLFEALQDKGNYQLELAANSKTIRDFDDAITRVSFGWPSVDAYYAGEPSTASSHWPLVTMPEVFGKLVSRSCAFSMIHDTQRGVAENIAKPSLATQPMLNAPRPPHSGAQSCSSSALG